MEVYSPKSRIPVSWIWFTYFLIKVMYSLLAINVVSKFVVLGDSARYLSSPVPFSNEVFMKSTYFMDFLGGWLGLIPYLGHIFACTISFYGIWYALKNLKLSSWELFWILLFLIFPTFSIWTSIFSKEAFAVFYLGVIFGFLVGVVENAKFKPNITEVLAFYLLILFKPQYLAAIIQTIIFMYIWQKFKSMSLRVTLVIVTIIFNFSLLYLFRDAISDLSFTIISHFSTDAASTRDSAFIWIEKYDVFKNMHIGMLIAFVGPTYQEALIKPIQMMAFIESAVVVFVFFAIILIALLKDISVLKFNVLAFFIVVNFLFWFLFAHYPFGVLNPGSALRYRSGFLPILFLIVVYFYYYRRKPLRLLE